MLYSVLLWCAFFSYEAYAQGINDSSNYAESIVSAMEIGMQNTFATIRNQYSAALSLYQPRVYTADYIINPTFYWEVL